MRARWRREIEQQNPGTVGLNEHGHLVDVGMVAQNEKRRELFAANPYCESCKQEITKLEDCSPGRLADGTEYLVHTACFGTMIQKMASRYFGRAS